MSFGRITWLVLADANRQRKERTSGNQSGGIDEAQGPLGVIIRLKGNRDECRVWNTQKRDDISAASISPRQPAATDKLAPAAGNLGRGATAEAARLTRERALGK